MSVSITLVEKISKLSCMDNVLNLGEIERCLLNTSISACVVTKWGDDHLIAYVQKSD